MKVMKRAPIRTNNIDVTELGHVIEVMTGAHRITWRKGSVSMLWDENQKALIWLEGIRKGPKKPVSMSAAVYKKWHKKNPNHERCDVFPDIPQGKWRKIGIATRVDYHSKKWGKNEEYTHDHGGGVGLYRYGLADKGPYMWVLKGGRLRVTARGIEG